MPLIHHGAIPRAATHAMRMMTAVRSSPGCIAQGEVMLVSAGAIENLSYQSQDIDCRNHDGAACNDRPHAVERIGMLERTGEDGHFGNETAESGQSQIGKTGDYIADSREKA